MEKTLAQALHSALVAQCNCQEKKNTDWDLKWGQRIKQLMDLAPSGSGFNAGTQLVKWDAGKLIFETAFHHMDEWGGYCGWTEHKVTVRPSWGGVDIKVSGRNRNGTKEYIEEVFGLWLLCCGKAPLQYFQPNERAEGVRALKELAGRVWVCG